jgi:hypothetical protein
MYSLLSKEELINTHYNRRNSSKVFKKRNMKKLVYPKGKHPTLDVTIQRS